MAIWKTTVRVAEWEGVREVSFNDETRQLVVQVLPQPGQCDGLQGGCLDCIERDRYVRAALANCLDAVLRIPGAGGLFLELTIPRGRKPLGYLSHVLREQVMGA